MLEGTAKICEPTMIKNPYVDLTGPRSTLK